MEQWIGFVLTLITIVGSFAVTIGILKKGQADLEKRVDKSNADTRNDFQEMKQDLKSVQQDVRPLVVKAQVHEEKLSVIAKTMDRNRHDTALSLDEIKGDVKRHNIELHKLQVWEAGVRARSLSGAAGD